MNVTTRIAVKITNLPPFDFDFDWADTAPQRPASSLVIEDFLPSSSDGKHLHERAVEYVAKFLVRQFSALKGLQKLCVQQTPAGDPQKTTIIPMAVMHRDEKYTEETIRILQDLT